MKRLRIEVLIIIVVMLLVGCSSSTTSDKEIQSTIVNNESDQIESNKVDEALPSYITPMSTKNNVDYTFVSFEDMAPEGYELKECWNGIGMDDQGRVYIGWTSVRPDEREDFVIYQYNPKTLERKFIGTMMQASEAAGNLFEGEAIPKGHTEIIQVGHKMYLGSQSFHDFKAEIDDLPNYRGGHLYAYDMENESFEDVSASLPGGVMIEHEGIVGLFYKEDSNELLGLTHPHSSIVFYDVESATVNKVVEGIPWALGNPLSRELIVDKHGMIYTYRGTESPNERESSFNMWIYDTNTDQLVETDQMFDGGFWSGQAATKDGDTIYISTVNGKLFSLDTRTHEVEDLGELAPILQIRAGIHPTYLYDITLSNDESTIYALPSFDYGNLYKYNIEKKIVTQITTLPDDVYTSNNLIDEEGNLYYSRFEPWDGKTRLMIIELE